MRGPHAICFWLLATVVYTVAAMVFPGAPAWAERLYIQVGPPNVHNLISDRLRLKKPAAVKLLPARSSVLSPGGGVSGAPGSSCFAPFRDYTLPALQLAGDSGDWVVLAGVTRPESNIFELKGPQFTVPAKADGFENWLYTFEMIFIPKGSWAVSASLSFDARSFSEHPSPLIKLMDPSHLDVVFSFDYSTQNPVALDFGYGRLPVEARVEAIESGTVTFNPEQAAEAAPEARVFTACLNIQF